MLGNGIRRCDSARHQARHRGGINNVALDILRQHQRRKNLPRESRPVNHAPQVHPDNPLPVVPSRFPRRAPCANPGVIEEQMHLADTPPTPAAPTLPPRPASIHPSSRTAPFRPSPSNPLPQPAGELLQHRPDTTFTPAPTHHSAIPRPMPLAAPVITATFPANSFISPSPILLPNPGSVR